MGVSRDEHTIKSMTAGQNLASISSADMSHSDVCTVVAGVDGQEHGDAQADGAQDTDPSDAALQSDEADDGSAEIDRDED